MARSSPASRSGSATTSIWLILSPEKVKASAISSRPRGAMIRPGAPLTRAIDPYLARAEAALAPPATAAAPWTVSGTPDGDAVASEFSTTSGSSTAIRPSRLPPRAAAMKASVTRRWRARRAPAAASASGSAPWIRRRPRLASWRAASGDRPVMEAISPNGRPNVSCRTNATRSAGGSVSSTTSSARPTESAIIASCSGPCSYPATTASIGSGSSGSSRRDLRERSRSMHTRRTMVVNHPSRLATSSAPPLAVARATCSQPSWTASSASLSEPSIRYAIARSLGRLASNRPASRSSTSIGPIVPVVFGHRDDGSRPGECDRLVARLVEPEDEALVPGTERAVNLRAVTDIPATGEQRLAQGELAAFPPGQRGQHVPAGRGERGGEGPAVGSGLGRARRRVRADRERGVADQADPAECPPGHRDVVDDLHERLGHPGHDLGDGRGELPAGGAPHDGDGPVPGRAGRQRHRPADPVPPGHQLVECLALGHVDVPDEVDQPLARGRSEERRVGKAC